MDQIEPIGRITFDASELLRRHPPRFEHPHKQRLFEGVSSPIVGEIEFSRWRGVLTNRLKLHPEPVLQQYENVFDYPAEESGETSWHLNFADRRLFGYYGGSLLAQDEHQVLEHPVLGSLREALITISRTQRDLVPLTEEARPTPCLIKGAHRSLIFDTVSGPYGNAFAASTWERVRGATNYLEPPTRSNILAMAAPAGGYGPYSAYEIENVLQIAVVGFAACKAESSTARTVIHTGNWGCGAFGGNLTLMVMLQLIASRIAGIDRIVFHTVSRDSTRGYKEALALLEELVLEQEVGRTELVERVRRLGLRWGVSDGN